MCKWNVQTMRSESSEYVRKTTGFLTNTHRIKIALESYFEELLQEFWGRNWMNPEMQIRSYFGSCYGWTRKCRSFCCASCFTEMDFDAAALLARTHATLVRQLSEIAGHHFEGLQAAARYTSLKLTNRDRRQLCHLDIAFNWSLHVTSVKCDMLFIDILSHASLTTAAPVYDFVAPAPIFTDLESVLEPPTPVVHTAPAPEIEYVAPTPDVTLATTAAVTQYAAPAHTVTFTAPSLVTEDVAHAPAVTYAAPAPVIEYVAPTTPVTANAYVAPAPVIDYIALSPAVFYPSFSQQLPPFDANEAVAVDA